MKRKESKVKSLSHVRLCDPMGRQEYWSGVPFPSPGDLPDPGLLHCQTLFFGAPKSLQMVIADMKLKDTYSLEENL